MNNSLINALGSLRSLQVKIDAIANNMANLNVNGYKRRDVSFIDTLHSQLDQPDEFNNEEGRLTPPGLRLGSGAKISVTNLNMSRGTEVKTDNPFDLMIEGDNGFFSVSNNNGITEEIRYTRDGAFNLSPVPDSDDEMNLVTATGEFVLDIDNNPVVIPRPNSGDYNGVRIDPQGNIIINENEFVNQIRLVNITRTDRLENRGSNQYALTITPEEADQGVLLEDLVIDVGIDEGITMKQGSIETSNVDFSREMTDLMIAQRAYQLSGRALTSADTLMNLANNLRG